MGNKWQKMSEVNRLKAIERFRIHSTKYPELQDKEWLIEQYISLRKTTTQIQKELNCSNCAIVTALRRNGISIRPKSERSIIHQLLNNEQWLKEQYLSMKKTTVQIAKETGCVVSTVYVALVRFDIPKRSRKEARKGIKFSDSHLTNIRKNNIKMAKFHSGKNHWNWQGGKTTETEKQRSKIKGSPEYRNWRKSVLEHDGYKCQSCGVSKNLHVHHKLSQSMFSHLRFDVDNGITLCSNCHFKLHSLENRVNSGKPLNMGNPEPSRVEPRKVQRLLEGDTSSLITSTNALHESDEIVRS